uniref:RNase H type-1 domain-containing protein n=1 Tax=Rhizophagus irregularis (strain DAOM 181602 / DAOM 197198 / MUCL 43194) TaxID=747089 RepID=U9SPV0_RHIID
MSELGTTVQVVKDSGFLNSIATYEQGIIRDWPSSSHAEAAAIYAALTLSPANSVVSIYTDSQTFIHGLKQCSLSTYSNSHLYYKTNNFELWAIIQQLIIDKSSRLTPIFIGMILLIPWPTLHSSQYMVNWALTWHTLMYQSNYDDSFTLENTSRHFMMKFQLFLKDLPTLKILKWLRPDLYIDIFTCRSCEDHLENFMHLFICKKRCSHMQQIMTSYLRHLIIKLTEAGELANHDPSAHIKTITSFPCWSFSSSNWSSYSLINGCLPTAFLNVFIDLDILRSSAMNVIAAIHNNFINKFRRRI